MSHSNDRYVHYIPGLCLLSQNKLLTADSHNTVLKLIDTSSKKITSRLRLTTAPWNATYLQDDQVAVTVPYERKVTIVTTSEELSSVRDIGVSGQCHGICFSDGKLLVTYSNPGKLEIMALDGTVYKAVVNNTKGNAVFTDPHYITLMNTNTERYIYVSDYSTDTTTKLTMAGDIVSQFKDQTLSGPRGLVAIGDNHIAVCSHGGDCITVIRDENGRMEIVKQRDCVESPLAIDFMPKENTLYVSCGGENDRRHVHLYEI